MWSGGISNPLSVIEQLTYLLFIKRLDELHTLKERKAARSHKPVEAPVFGADQEHLRWSRFKETAPEQMHGQRPIIFYTNGYETWLWDDSAYPPRQVAGFYKKDELQRLILRRSQRQKLDVAQLKNTIVDRYYQKRAIGSIFEQFTQSRRKALLVMATGTGKTRTAIALLDALQRAGWVKRALFLADRVRPRTSRSQWICWIPVSMCRKSRQPALFQAGLLEDQVLVDDRARHPPVS